MVLKGIKGTDNLILMRGLGKGNERGDKLVEFRAKHKLVIAKKFLKNHKRRRYTTVIKFKGEFCYKMKNIYLFIQINFFPFRYNALMPTFFPIVETLVKFDFRNCLQSLQRLGFYLLNRVKTVSPERSLEFAEQPEVTRS